MNAFFEILKKNYETCTLNTEKFMEALTDEEFIDDDKVLRCYRCMDSEEFEILYGGDEFFRIIEEKKNTAKNKNYIHALHIVEKLEKWVGGLTERETQAYDTMQTTVCKKCNSILAVKVLDAFYVPYCDYIEMESPMKPDTGDLTYKGMSVSKFCSNENINYKDFKKNYNNMKNDVDKNILDKLLKLDNKEIEKINKACEMVEDGKDIFKEDVSFAAEVIRILVDKVM